MKESHAQGYSKSLKQGKIDSIPLGGVLSAIALDRLLFSGLSYWQVVSLSYIVFLQILAQVWEDDWRLRSREIPDFSDYLAVIVKI